MKSWETSAPLYRNTERVLSTVFKGQMILFGGPWLAVALLYAPYYFHKPSMPVKDWLLAPSRLILGIAMRRLYKAKVVLSENS